MPLFKDRIGFLSVVLMAAGLAFYGGRLSVLKGSIVKENPSREVREPDAAKMVTQSVVPDSLALSQNMLWDDRWMAVTAQPRTPASEQTMAALIEELARNNPQRAISLAVTQDNLRRRATLLRSALKGWGETNPEAAAEWAQSQTVLDQPEAINALLQGAVQNPDRAAALVTSLIQKDTSRGSEYSCDLISALNESGQFDRAADFALKSPVNCRDDLVLAAYSRWAEFQPQDAVANANQITDPVLRDAIMNAIIVGWSPTDPRGMVEFALGHLPSNEQNAALSSAIQFWAGSDPRAAADWINQNNPGGVSDPGIAEIALSSQLAQQPELAANWAESILNPQLRMETLTTVMGKWASINLADAINFVQNSPQLQPENRSALLDQLNSIKP